MVNEKGNNQAYRLREIDFLRGIAIILVLIRHSQVNQLLVNMGWIGVDLFFVLSGFLVSGLLFREFKTFSTLNIKRFLIRRGFKIYPLFYITAIPYVILYIVDGNFLISRLLGDLLFLQNYVSDWGYLYPAGWSLAVEEHFYFGIAFVLFFAIKSPAFKLAVNSKEKWFDRVVATIVILIILVFMGRVLGSRYLSNEIAVFSQSHYRIDALLFGVLLSYLYNFKFQVLKKFYEKYRRILILICFLGLTWTPFIDPIPSFFAKTFGFSLLSISFFILLLCFILDKKINDKLDTIFSRLGVNLISKIGVSSYSIYIIHTLVNLLIHRAFSTLDLYSNPYILFFLTTFCSVFLGFFLTKYVEQYFLKLRDRYFPRTASAL